MLPQQTLDDIENVWSLSDLRQAEDHYAQTHPDGSGLAIDVFLGSQYEMRIIDILQQLLPNQLLATPLIRPEMQVMATRLAASLGDDEIGDWTSANPPAVAKWYIGDVMDSLRTNELPQVVVSLSLPGGNTVTSNTVGLTADQNVNFYIFYLLAYKPSIRRQVETGRGAEAIANIMASYKSDCLTGWQNGNVTIINRNATLSPQDGSVQAHAGIVEFSMFRRTPYLSRVSP